MRGRRRAPLAACGRVCVARGQAGTVVGVGRPLAETMAAESGGEAARAAA